MNSNTKKILGKGRQSKVTQVTFSNNNGTRERKVIGMPDGHGSEINTAALRRKSGRKPMTITK